MHLRSVHTRVRFRLGVEVSGKRQHHRVHGIRPHRRARVDREGVAPHPSARARTPLAPPQRAVRARLALRTAGPAGEVPPAGSHLRRMLARASNSLVARFVTLLDAFRQKRAGSVIRTRCNLYASFHDLQRCFKRCRRGAPDAANEPAAVTEPARSCYSGSARALLLGRARRRSCGAHAPTWIPEAAYKKSSSRPVWAMRAARSSGEARRSLARSSTRASNRATCSAAS